MTDPTPPLIARPFWYLRHGETDWNKDNLAQGSVDVPLNDTGIAQARQAAALLEGQDIARIVCSPLMRARATAEIVAAPFNLPVAIDPELREAAFGVMEGQPMLAQWFSEWIAGAFTPEDAEPFAALIARAVGAVNAALSACPGPVLIVAHGSLFRALRCAMGLSPSQRLVNGVPQFCAPGTPWTLSSPG